MGGGNEIKRDEGQSKSKVQQTNTKKDKWKTFRVTCNNDLLNFATEFLEFIKKISKTVT